MVSAYAIDPKCMFRGTIHTTLIRLAQVNDVPMQKLLLDRRMVYKQCAVLGIVAHSMTCMYAGRPTVAHAVLTRRYDSLPTGALLSTLHML